jgi:hypothetical protein
MSIVIRSLLENCRALEHVAKTGRPQELRYRAGTGIIGRVDQPVFNTLPVVESIEPTDDSACYLVTLREQNGNAQSALMTVQLGSDDIPLLTCERDLFWRWPGDAASVRAVCDRVIAFHRAQA